MASTQSSTMSTASHFQSMRSARVPPDLGTYSRALLSYTQRQMECLRIGHDRSEASFTDKSASPPVSVPLGTPSSASTTTARRRSPSAVTSASRSSAAVHPSSPASSEFGYRE